MISELLTKDEPYPIVVYVLMHYMSFSSGLMHIHIGFIITTKFWCVSW